MEHRLLRDTPSIVEPTKHQPRYMHFLNLSRFPNHAFICTSRLPKDELEEAAAAAIAATKLLSRPQEFYEPEIPLPPLRIEQEPQEPVPEEPQADDDELQLIQQQELLFKQHREQRQQQEAKRKQEEEERAKEEEQRKLEEQQMLLFASAGQQNRPAEAAETGQEDQESEEQQKLKDQQKKQEEEEANEPEEKKMVMVTVDTPSLYNFYTMIVRAANPLWMPRHTVTVPHASSAVFELENFVVRIGEVKQTAPATRTRGVIVEIDYKISSSPDDDEEDETWPLDYDDTLDDHQSKDPVLLTPEDWETGESVIREFWKRFAVPGAREYIRVKHIGEEARLARQQGLKRLTTWKGSNPPSDGITGVDLARQYMEAFRIGR